MARRVARIVRAALVSLAALAAVAWAASSPPMAMRFEVTGMRLVLPTLPESGSRPPAEFYARSATGTMAEGIVVFATDVTGSARMQLQAGTAAQDSTLSSPYAVLGQPAGSVVFPRGLRVQWASGELTATHGLAQGSQIELEQPAISSERLTLHADHGLVQVRTVQQAGGTPAGALDATFTTHVRVVLR